MKYEFKAWAELAWAVGVTASVAVLQLLVEFDPTQVSDWRFWVISLGGAAVRAAAGGAIAVLSRPRE